MITEADGAAAILQRTSVPLRPHDGSTGQYPRLHLAYLDGLRGLAAFYVLLFHIVAEGKQTLTADGGAMNLLRFGHEAVVVFIVLSGFVLTLPVIQLSSVALTGGVRGFAKRRARRILPPYYPALLMGPIFLGFIALLKQQLGEDPNWRSFVEMNFGPSMLLSLVLLQNFLHAIPYSLNPVLWSVATEWWIYFAFALVVLPIWRRTHVTWALLVSMGLGLMALTLPLLGLPVLNGYPYLLGAFGLGMFAAAALFSGSHGSDHKSWPRLLEAKSGLVGWTAIFLFICISIVLPFIRQDDSIRWITDWLIAVACSVFIFVTARAKLVGKKVSRPHAYTVRSLESRPLAFLGRISYSLYLTHLMVWSLLGLTLGTEAVNKFVSFSFEPMPIRILVAIPLLICFAYVFYRLFERPFLRHH